MAVHKINNKATASKSSNNKLDLSAYDNIRLLGKQVVLFVWYDELVASEYTNSFGIILTRELSKTKARWGVVVKCTPDCDVKVGEYILPLNVTEEYGCNINDIETWRTTTDLIQLVSDDVSVIDLYEDA